MAKRVADPKYTLYFYQHDGTSTPARGEAEKIRMMLAECGFKYDDIAISTADVDSMIADQTIMSGKLPVLREQIGDDDIYYEMSSAIMEHIAETADKLNKGSAGNKYAGLPEEVTQIRAIGQLATEFQEKIQTIKGKSGAPADANDLIERYFKLFQGYLVKNDDDDVRTDEYTYGKQFTWADVSVFEAVNAVLSVYGVGKVRPYTKLKEFHDKVAMRSRIQMRISTRPDAK